MPLNSAMTAGHCSAVSRARRRKLAAVVCAFSILSVNSIQTPTHPKAQEPDAAPQEAVFVRRNDTEASPTANTNTRAHYSAKPPQIPVQPSHDEFMTWCKEVLGIQTSLEIQDFEYPDFMRIRMTQDDDDDELCDTQDDESLEFPTIFVRGLAATQDIQVGDVVISIPFHALLTIPTTIDHDPVLSGRLGPSARSKHGWEDAYFETPLLTIAILYHFHLGKQSPLHNYMELLERAQESMPLLWNRKQLKQEATSGVRKLVRGIQSDVKEMYETVMVPLQEEHATIFGNDDYSLEKFQWAFSMVNSRHWYLPIPDLSEQHTRAAVAEETEYGGYNEQVLPASQPTEEWVREQGEQDADDVLVDKRAIRRVTTTTTSPPRDNHSFMAPVADLLNFGPPCTRGSYNEEKKAFELIATCPFLAGQEVTFWYSDDCEDVIIANYGFTHPMVPRCPSADFWQQKSDLWKRRAQTLETRLEESYKELGRMDVELEDVRVLLRKCDCEEQVPEARPSEEKEKIETRDDGPAKLRRFRPPEEPIETADGLRGVRDGESIEDDGDAHGARHGVRKPQWHRHGSKSGNSSL